MNPENNLSQLLDSVRAGHPCAEERLFSAVYEELQRIAHRQLNRERPGLTLQTTALVNEAYLRMAGGAAGPTWENRRHFFWAAAESMRRILIDRARRHQRLKRGRDFTRIPLDPEKFPAAEDTRLLEVDEALTELEALDPLKAKIVKLRYFVGLTVDETAGVVDKSPRSVKEEWRVARLWLQRHISRTQE